MRTLFAGAMIAVASAATASEPRPMECLSQEMHEVALHSAMIVTDFKADGVTEREMIEEAMATEDKVMRAVLLAAVSKVYSGHHSLSATATAMQLACHDAASE